LKNGSGPTFSVVVGVPGSERAGTTGGSARGAAFAVAEGSEVAALAVSAAVVAVAGRLAVAVEAGAAVVEAVAPAGVAEVALVAAVGSSAALSWCSRACTTPDTNLTPTNTLRVTVTPSNAAVQRGSPGRGDTSTLCVGDKEEVPCQGRAFFHGSVRRLASSKLARAAAVSS
jgi:hypothetical protein